jgi:hypothetical protein
VGSLRVRARRQQHGQTRSYREQASALHGPTSVTSGDPHEFDVTRDRDFLTEATGGGRDVISLSFAIDMS